MSSEDALGQGADRGPTGRPEDAGRPGGPRRDPGRCGRRRHDRCAGHRAAPCRPDRAPQQPPPADGDAFQPASGGQDARRPRLQLPAVGQARADRLAARARLRGPTRGSWSSTRSATSPSPAAAPSSSSSSSTVATSTPRRCSRRTRASSAGARSCTTRSWPPPCWTVCSTAATSSTSAATATGCGATPNSPRRSTQPPPGPCPPNARRGGTQWWASGRDPGPAPLRSLRSLRSAGAEVSDFRWPGVSDFRRPLTAEESRTSALRRAALSTGAADGPC